MAGEWYHTRVEVNGQVVGVMRTDANGPLFTEDPRQVAVWEGNGLQVNVGRIRIGDITIGPTLLPAQQEGR